MVLAQRALLGAQLLCVAAFLHGVPCRVGASGVPTKTKWPVCASDDLSAIHVKRFHYTNHLGSVQPQPPVLVEDQPSDYVSEYDWVTPNWNAFPTSRIWPYEGVESKLQIRDFSLNDAWSPTDGAHDPYLYVQCILSVISVLVSLAAFSAVISVLCLLPACLASDGHKRKRSPNLVAQIILASMFMLCALFAFQAILSVVDIRPGARAVIKSLHSVHTLAANGLDAADKYVAVADASLDSAEGLKAALEATAPSTAACKAKKSLMLDLIGDGLNDIGKMVNSSKKKLQDTREGLPFANTFPAGLDASSWHKKLSDAVANSASPSRDIIAGFAGGLTTPDCFATPCLEAQLDYLYDEHTIDVENLYKIPMYLVLMLSLIGAVSTMAKCCGGVCVAFLAFILVVPSWALIAPAAALYAPLQLYSDACQYGEVALVKSLNNMPASHTNLAGYGLNLTELLVSTMGTLGVNATNETTSVAGFASMTAGDVAQYYMMDCEKKTGLVTFDDLVPSLHTIAEQVLSKTLKQLTAAVEDQWNTPCQSDGGKIVAAPVVNLLPEAKAALQSSLSCAALSAPIRAIKSGVCCDMGYAVDGTTFWTLGTGLAMMMTVLIAPCMMCMFIVNDEHKHKSSSPKRPKHAAKTSVVSVSPEDSEGGNTFANPVRQIAAGSGPLSPTTQAVNRILGDQRPSATERLRAALSPRAEGSAYSPVAKE